MPSEISTLRNVMFNVHGVYMCEVDFSTMAQCLMLQFIAEKLAHFLRKVSTSNGIKKRHSIMCLICRLEYKINKPFLEHVPNHAIPYRHGKTKMHINNFLFRINVY